MAVLPSAAPRARRKEAARALLDAYDLDGIARWAEGEPQALGVLQRVLFDPDERLAWRAVEAIGRVAAVLGRGDPEPVRELARRTLWLMNDESGGLLWHAPQVLGVALAHVPVLVREFGDVLASFLEEEPFRAGTRWGLWRLAAVAPEVARRAAPELDASFRDPDPAVRGHAALALRAAGWPVPDLSGDGGVFTAFDWRTGELRALSVAAAAGPEPLAPASAGGEAR